jgi:hypothetical protein
MLVQASRIAELIEFWIEVRVIQTMMVCHPVGERNSVFLDDGSVSATVIRVGSILCPPAAVSYAVQRKYDSPSATRDRYPYQNEPNRQLGEILINRSQSARHTTRQKLHNHCRL